MTEPQLSRRALLGSGALLAAGILVLEGVGPLSAVAAPPGSDGAARADRFLVAPGTTSAPDATGVLPATAWSAATTAVGAEHVHTGTADPAISLSVLAGPVHLHLQLRVQAALADRPALVEVLLSPEGKTDVFRLRIPLRTVTPTPIGVWGGTVRNFTSITPVVVSSATEVSAEAAIRYSAFGGASGTTGAEWRLNVVAMYGVDEAPARSWVPVREAMVSDKGDPTVQVQAPLVEHARFGSLFLRSMPTSLGSPWGSSTISTSYLDPQTLRVEVSAPSGLSSVAARWREPGGSWQELAAPALVTGSGTATVTVAHPRFVTQGVHHLALIATTSSDTRTLIVDLDREDTVQLGVSTIAAVVPAPSRRTLTASERVVSAAAEDLLALVPDRTGLYFCGLPEQPTLRPERVFTFDPADPDVLHTEFGALTYPNTTYPEDRTLTVTHDNQSLSYPYHQDSAGRRYFFSAHLWYLKRQYALRELVALAQADIYGAATVIEAFAEAYQTYVPTNDYMWRNYPLTPDHGPPYHAWGGTWLRWGKSDLWDFSELLRAYLLVNATSAFDDLSALRGHDVRERIRQDMVRPSLRYVDTLPTSHYNYSNWLGFALASRVLGEPDLMHRAVELILEFVDINFLFDGMHTLATVSYHVQLTEGMLVAADAVTGWSDPAGYVSPRDGQTYSDLDLRADLPVIGSMARIPERLVYPNGRVLPLQDTWASDEPAGAVLDSGSWYLPATRVARLARQSGGADIATAYVQMHPKYGGHIQHDALNICLFEHGQELLPDLGYTHTRYRMWSRCQLAHNTVVVDGADMVLDEASRHGGRLQHMVLEDSGLQFFAGEQSNAYPQTDVYARELLSVPTTAGHYYLDVFRVEGGDRHEYTLNGDTNADAVATTDLTTAVYGDYLLPPGVVVTPPTNETDPGDAQGHYYGYIYVRDVERAAMSSGGATVTMTTSPGAPGEPSGASLITHLLTDDDAELFLGRSQSLRGTRLGGRPEDTNAVADDGNGEPRYTMPKLVVRREGSDLQTTFIAAIEAVPASGAPVIVSATRVPVVTGGAGAVAVEIDLGGGVRHLVLSAPDGAAMSTASASMTGRLGVVELAGSAVTAMRLVDGTDLTCSGETLTAAAPPSGALLGTRRVAVGDPVNALVVSGVLPADVVGRHAIVDHPDTSHGYLVVGRSIEGSTTVLDLGDAEPGLTGTAATGFSLAFHPFRSWSAPLTVRISMLTELPS